MVLKFKGNHKGGFNLEVIETILKCHLNLKELAKGEIFGGDRIKAAKVLLELHVHPTIIENKKKFLAQRSLRESESQQQAGTLLLVIFYYSIVTLDYLESFDKRVLRALLSL